MSAWLRRACLAFALALCAVGMPLGGVHAAARSVALVPGIAPSSVAIAGDWQNKVLYGSAGRYWEGHDTVSWSQDAYGVSISATRTGQKYPLAMTFQAPADQQLQIGRYVVKREYDAPPPPTIKVNGGSSCSKQYGEFDVLDLAPERLWLTFRATCNRDGLGPSVYGEVRFGQPLVDDLLTIPTRMPWGPTPLGETNDPVPVTLVNLAQGDLTVSQVRADGPDAADFTVGSAEGCGTVPAGGSCNVDVTFEPEALGARSATLAVADSRSNHEIGLSGTGVPAPDWSDIPRPEYSHYPTCDVAYSVVEPNAITFRWGDDCDLQHRKYYPNDTSHYLIRGSEGPTRPAVEGDGFHVYSGHGRSTTVGGFDPTKQYSFTLFTQHSDGAVKATPMSVSAPVISAVAALENPTKGSGLVVSGTVTVPDGRPITGLPLELRVIYPGAGEAVVLESGQSDSEGGYAFRTVPTRAATYVVTYSTTGRTVFPGSSPSRYVPLSVAVSLKAPAGALAYGKATTLTGTVTPGQAKVPVQLQVYVGGRWKGLTTAIADAKGGLSFKFTPKDKGTLGYRVLWQGSAVTWTAASKTVKITVK